MIKLIVSDLDETLLGSDGSVSQANIDAIVKAHQKGVKFVPNTGRGFDSVQRVLRTLKLYDLANEYVISFNGGAIVENKNQKVIATNGMTFEQAKQIFDITSNQPGFDTHVYTLDKVYIYDINPVDRAYIETRDVVITPLEKKDFKNLAGQPILKVISMHPDQDKREMLMQMVKEGIDFDVTGTYSSNMYTEFNLAGVDKGSATLELADRLGIKSDEIMALGDNSNDLAMLQKVGLPIAVSNATDEVKQVAKYVTKNNYVNGVAEAINRFVL